MKTTTKREESQLTRIKNHLAKGYGISPLYALNKFGCSRLAARIFDLRSQGISIKTQMLQYDNKTFARYLLQIPAPQ